MRFRIMSNPIGWFVEELDNGVWKKVNIRPYLNANIAMSQLQFLETNRSW